MSNCGTAHLTPATIAAQATIATTVIRPRLLRFRAVKNSRHIRGA
jgi:hypothetical protein